MNDKQNYHEDFQFMIISCYLIEKCETFPKNELLLTGEFPYRFDSQWSDDFDNLFELFLKFLF